MADTPAEVISFIRTMAGRAKPFAIKDMQELRDFAKAALGMDDVQAWDVPYISEKLRLARYSYSDTEVKQYFTEPRVMAGLFELIQTLFNVQLAPAQAALWHADARFYTITREGRELAHLYVDNYARTGKRGGAWMDVARPRRLKAGQLQTPVAYVTCNFGAPAGDKPALLSHDQVTTLFHEFGHALHHVLTQVDEPSVDMRAVEWDAIELPSQFMENFCWEWDVVCKMSCHVDTGQSLPRELFDKMLAAKNFQSGMFAVRQMEFALFDMLLHTEFDAGKAAAGGPGIDQVLQAVRDEVSVVPVPGYNRLAHSFSHIFGGGYAAGYYSYKWAEVMSADAYSLFEEIGALNPQAGALFLKEILEVGGTRPARDSFRAFRGRDPQVDALLRHSGMTESA
jgi:oligopeptidase A